MMPTSSVARARAVKSSSLVRVMNPCIMCRTRSVYGTNPDSEAAAADPIADCSQQCFVSSTKLYILLFNFQVKSRLDSNRLDSTTDVCRSNDTTMSSQGNLKLLIRQSKRHVVFRVFQYFRTTPCKSPGYLGEDFAKLQAISPLTGPSMAKSPPSNSHKMLPVHKMPSPAQHKSSSTSWSFIDPL